MRPLLALVLRANRATSALVGLLAARVARWDGATCTDVDGLRVCAGARGRSFARGGTCYGDTYVTGSSPAAVSPERLRHERVHQEQWRRFGLLFPLLYALAGADPLRNRFETAAGLEDGGYRRAGR
ncbi:hypothetical protein [Quadrisphaera sp. DSM 44207]|uniref:hypothetical protein n=1 Tax=Quadrisphaera sp. DSM 44207 TaxID=1881057 RepID=UPI00088402FE|nr:hypothetical protein [Quadrisphaera sp. DSM 44207]SDQ09499.1 hypothetical protein SAMN05428996_0495 [Quadrisphaera sp. DSM 44207]